MRTCAGPLSRVRRPCSWHVPRAAETLGSAGPPFPLPPALTGELPHNRLNGIPGTDLVPIRGRTNRRRPRAHRLRGLAVRRAQRFLDPNTPTALQLVNYAGPGTYHAGPGTYRYNTRRPHSALG